MASFQSACRINRDFFSNSPNKAIDEANQEFAKIEQIKKFTIADRSLSQEEGELTPTLKVKRAVVYNKYAANIDALYESD